MLSLKVLKAVAVVQVVQECRVISAKVLSVNVLCVKVVSVKVLRC